MTICIAAGMENGSSQMRLVILESPFSGTSGWRLIRWWQNRRNIRYARACVRDSLSRDEAPIASHLLYTQRGILKDHIPAERWKGIDAGLAWCFCAEATVVYVDRGISSGMRAGMQLAESLGVPIEVRRIYDAVTS